MAEFLTLTNADTGATERIDPFAVKRIADTGHKTCTVYGFAFEGGVTVDCTGKEVERIVTQARSNPPVYVANPPADSTRFPHPDLVGM